MSDAVRVSLYGRQTGRLLAYVEPALEMVNWRLNNVGMARFFLPFADGACTPTNLALGNRVLIEFSNGLPDWGGVIDVPRRIDSNGVTVTAYTGEKLLDWRVTPKARYFSQQTPGTIVQTLLQEENGIWPTGVSVGDIWTGGTARTLEYHYHDLLRRIQDLQRLSEYGDFDVTPNVSGGVIAFAFNWYETLGQDRSGSLVLIDGHNVGQVVLDEQGPLASHVRLAGEGSTWGDERPTSEAVNTATRDQYGYREYAEVQSGVKVQATLDANVEALLAAYATPHEAYSLRDALNRAPALWADYDVGDTLALQAFPDTLWAVEDTIQVVAREWRPDGLCQLEVI
jgi:hypothetical protein